MNGVKKFHSPDAPAFNPGEQWIGTSGAVYEVLSTRRYSTDKWGVDVCYCMITQPEVHWTKDAWNFQFRFTHRADLAV